MTTDATIVAREMEQSRSDLSRAKAHEHHVKTRADSVDMKAVAAATMATSEKIMAALELRLTLNSRDPP